MEPSTEHTTATSVSSTDTSKTQVRHKSAVLETAFVLMFRRFVSFGEKTCNNYRYKTITVQNITAACNYFNTCTVHLLLFCTKTNQCTQLFHKLSHRYMFRHYCVILRQPAVNTLPRYTSISNAAVGNTVYNVMLFHTGFVLLK